MKKFIAITLVVIMCLSFVACGNSKNDVDNYIGVWETENMVLTLNKGGVGEYYLKGNTGKYTLEWEIVDEVVVTKFSSAGLEYTGTLELNDEATELTVVQNGFPAYVEGQTTFIKQK